MFCPQISLFNTCLKPDGKIYLAAKIHYFGVGGGVRLFEQALDQTKAWKYSTVKTYEEGVAREILEICRITNWCNIRFVSKAVLAFFFYRFWQIKRIEMHFVFEFICWKACDISMHNINKMEKIVTRIITKVEFYLNKIFLGRSSKLSYKALRMSIIIRLFHWNLLILGFPFYQMVKHILIGRKLDA